MNEMIERAASAMFLAETKWHADNPGYFPDDLRVCAVIEAMRRPLCKQLGDAAKIHGGDRVFWSSLLSDIISDVLSEKL